jgi:hypothetical protein
MGIFGSAGAATARPSQVRRSHFFPHSRATGCNELDHAGAGNECRSCSWNDERLRRLSRTLSSTAVFVDAPTGAAAHNLRATRFDDSTG